MPATSVCQAAACRTVVEGRVARCPRCGAVMASSRALRVRGGVLLACGLFLVGLIAAVPTLARLFMDPGFVFALPDDPVEAALLMAPVGLVVGFGLVAAVAGGWQLMTARSVPHLPIVLLGILMATMLVFGLATIVLDGDAVRPMPPRSVLP
jgi:hypothetical protein